MATSASQRWRCWRIWTDHRRRRPQLDAVRDQLRSGDTLTVTCLDKRGRNVGPAARRNRTTPGATGKAVYSRAASWAHRSRS